MRILIVDDSRAMRMIVKRALRAAGYGRADIIETTDGEEALQICATKKPEIVLSDWNMPRCGGEEFLRRYRAAQYEGRFGFVTSAATEEMRAVAKELAADFLVTKPFTSDRFKEALEGRVSQLSIPQEPNAIQSLRSSQGDPLGAHLCQRLISDVLRRDFEARDVRQGTSSPEIIVGVYAMRDEPFQAAAIVDRALACHLGAALSLFPKSVAEEAMKGDFPPSLMENLHEVLNLFCQSMGGGSGGQVSLRTIETSRMRARTLAKRFSRLPDVAHVELSIEGYGSGVMTLCRLQVEPEPAEVT